MNLVLFGAPGSGKGTQAERLREEFGLRHVSTGDLLRAAVAAGSELGRKVEGILAAGDLVSDDIVLELIEEAVVGVKTDASLSGWILDGFPRTIGQARLLDDLLARTGEGIDAVVVLEVDRDAVIKRLSSRRVCTGCKTVYNLLVNPPAQEGKCDKCGGEVIQRTDDSPDTIANRLDVYAEQTRPILDYYEGRVRIERVDGNQRVEQVTQDIVRRVG